MPQNMQKKPQVADLSLDENQQLAEQIEAGYAETAAQAEEVATMSETDARYLEALKYYQHGNSQKKIATRLAKNGMTRLQAARLAKRVMEENPQEEYTNAMILLGAGGFFAVVGVLLIIGRVLGTGTLPIFAPSYAFILIGAWFGYKGFQAFRNLRDS